LYCLVPSIKALSPKKKKIDFFQLHIIYEVKRKKKEIRECDKMNKRIDFFQLHIIYEVKGKKKKYVNGRERISK
jgi:hypothetical protein